MKQFFTLLLMGLAFAGTSQTTFNVDMTCAPEFTDVFVTGPWCGWCANEGYNQAMDDDGDGVYTVVIADLTGDVEYKYAINGFADQENLINDMAELEATCAPVTDFATYANRTTTADSVNDDFYGTCDGTCNDSTLPVATVGVTFHVDMNEYTGGYGTVNLNGSFNGWCGACATMLDEDGDGVFSLTVELDTAATVEYKFTLDGWTAQEMFNEGDECTSTIDGYTNRTLTVGTEATELDVVCYDSCSACENGGGGGGSDSTYQVTFNVNMALEEVDPTGVYLAGGTNFGVPGDNPMTDDDGDGIYSVTVELEAGFSGHYTFTNGACGDWSCKENLAGLPCGDPSNYNDRFLPAITGDTTISTCFGQCSEDGSCTEISAVPVTFRVDMSEQLVVSGVTIFGGSINGWNNTATPLADDDGDGIYEVTVDLLPGGHEYKFVNSGVEEIFDPIVHGECTVTTPDSVYTNRYLLIEEQTEIETIAYCFNSCDACTPDNVLEQNGFGFQIIPSVTSDLVDLRFNGANNAPCAVNLVSFNGALVSQFSIPANTTSWTLDMTEHATGVYFVQMHTNGLVATEKLVKVQ